MRAVVILMMTATAALADVPTLQRYFTALVASESTTTAASVAIHNTSGVDPTNSVALGTRDAIQNIPNSLDVPYPIGALTEPLVAAAVLQLVNDGTLPALDAAIPATLLPRGVAIVNPSFPNVPLTLTMLLQHTSSLNDAGFDTFTAQAPQNNATAFIDFMESYFTVMTGGVASASPTVWAPLTPGAVSTYNFARANMALLGYIAQTATTSATDSAESLVQSSVTAVLGMATTFPRSRTMGALPTLTNGVALYDNLAMALLATATTAASTFTIHPAAVADFMYLSSTLDQAKLARGLFLSANSALLSVGTAMRTASTSINVSTVPNRRSDAIVGVGLGLSFFDPLVFCTTQLVTPERTCPLTAANTVWGYASVTTDSLQGTFCSDVVSPTPCVSASMSFVNSGTTPRSFNVLYGLAGAAITTAYGALPAAAAPSSNRNDIFGLYAALTVVGIMFAVSFAAYVTEELLPPVVGSGALGDVAVPEAPPLPAISDHASSQPYTL